MPYTSNKKPSGLDAASSVGNDTIVIEQSGSVLKATVSQLEDRVFGSKTAVTSPDGSEVVVVRTSGNLIRQVALSNIVPALNITDAKVSSNTGDRISGNKITPNFGSQTVQTTGQVSAGSLAVSGNSTMGGTLVVTGALTANGGINATITGTASSANTLTTTRNIAATGDIGWNVNFNGGSDVTAAATIQPNVVTDAKLRSGTACSVIGRSGNTTGNVADIAASANDRVLLRTSDALSFGQINAGMIATDAVTSVKIQNDAVTADKLQDDASTDANRAVTSNHIRDLAITTGKIANLAVDNSKIANSTIELGKLVAAVQNALVPVGTVQTFARDTAPTGWLAANGGTFGSASSGATSAAADYEALFTLLWANGWTDANLPILTSAGGASTRGASAAADWTANKRLTLPDLRGIFVRGSGSQTISGTSYSGTFAAKQPDSVIAHTHGGTTGDDFPDHTHNYNRPGFSASRGSGQVGAAVSEFGTNTTGASARHQHGFTTSSQSPTGGTETRPANIALLYCIKF